MKYRKDTVVFSSWKLARMIGRTASSAVYEAQDGTGGRCAIKVIHARGRELHATLSESILQSSFTGEMPVQESNTIWDGDWFDLQLRLPVMESLRQRLLSQSALATPDAASLGLGILDALDGSEYVHGNLTPNNVFLADGNVLVSDFNVAAALETIDVDYAAPEVILQGETDEPADLYSLGLVLYRCLCGRLPFLDDGPATADGKKAALERRLRGEAFPMPDSLAEKDREAIRRLCSLHPEERPTRDEARAMLAGGDSGAAEAIESEDPFDDFGFAEQEDLPPAVDGTFPIKDVDLASVRGASGAPQPAPGVTVAPIAPETPEPAQEPPETAPEPAQELSEPAQEPLVQVFDRQEEHGTLLFGEEPEAETGESLSAGLDDHLLPPTVLHHDWFAAWKQDHFKKQGDGDQRTVIDVESDGGTVVDPVTEEGKAMCVSLRDAQEQRSFSLQVTEKGASIGRRDCSLNIDYNPTVSRHHCDLEVDGGNLYVVNRSSTNPTMINDVACGERALLRTGDVLRLGKVRLKVTINENGKHQ